MARRFGLLSVAMTALALAVGGYFVQGAGADTAPVQVADFSAAPAALASAADVGDEYDAWQDDSGMLHATASADVPACQDGAGLSTLKLNDEVGLVCLNGDVLGYLVTIEGEKPRIVLETDAKDARISGETCPAQTGKLQPDA